MDINAFMPQALEIDNSNSGFKRASGIVLFNQEKHFLYQNAYGPPTWRGGDLP